MSTLETIINPKQRKAKKRHKIRTSRRDLSGIGQYGSACIAVIGIGTE
ncbi:hypothetical protein OKT23_12150 [Providencia rettgeri]|nr:hypothetical protein [Providencia rettgeri]MCL0017263.1 hypothetical protein [Providencia rettgeri]MCX9125501.1 hypothetical protein [Providencia rettgeri]MCX9130106.1 hypothetical protein [Providencia rettgeri]